MYYKYRGLPGWLLQTSDALCMCVSGTKGPLFFHKTLRMLTPHEQPIRCRPDTICTVLFTVHTYTRTPTATHTHADTPPSCCRSSMTRILCSSFSRSLTATCRPCSTPPAEAQEHSHTHPYIRTYQCIASTTRLLHAHRHTSYCN